MLQLFDHCCTHLWGVQRSEAVVQFDALLRSPDWDGIPDAKKIASYNAFFVEAETCLVGGATAADKERILLVERLWSQHQATHGFPYCGHWDPPAEWYEDDPEHEGLRRKGWDLTSRTWIR